MPRLEPLMPASSFVVLGAGTDPLAMNLSHRGPLFSARIQPVEDQRFYNPLRIGQMLSAVIFKGSEGFVVETIRSLNRLGVWLWF